MMIYDTMPHELEVQRGFNFDWQRRLSIIGEEREAEALISIAEDNKCSRVRKDGRQENHQTPLKLIGV